MKKFNSIPALSVSFIFIILISCNQNDEQRKFEEEVFSLPENITETNGNGEIVEGHEDPNDWRIAPFFQGVVDVDIPFPNPLLTNQQLNLYVRPYYIDTINGLRIYVLSENQNLRLLREDPRSPLPPGPVYFSLKALEIAQIPANPQGLYRIIIQDGQGAIISYGDVRIE